MSLKITPMTCFIATAGERSRPVPGILRGTKHGKKSSKKTPGPCGCRQQKLRPRRSATGEGVLSGRSPLWSYVRSGQLLGSQGHSSSVALQRVREYTHVYSATCPADGDTFSLILPYANTEMMKLFMLEFSRHCQDYRVVMVMDQAPWLKAKELMLFKNIRIIYQPPYSPEVNPVEHLWEHLREKYFGNRFWSTIEQLEWTLTQALREVSRQKDTIQNLVGFHWAIL